MLFIFFQRYLGFPLAFFVDFFFTFTWRFFILWSFSVRYFNIFDVLCVLYGMYTVLYIDLHQKGNWSFTFLLTICWEAIVFLHNKMGHLGINHVIQNCLLCIKEILSDFFLRMPQLFLARVEFHCYKWFAKYMREGKPKIYL